MFQSRLTYHGKRPQLTSWLGLRESSTEAPYPLSDLSPRRFQAPLGICICVFDIAQIYRSSYTPLDLNSKAAQEIAGLRQMYLYARLTDWRKISLNHYCLNYQGHSADILRNVFVMTPCAAIVRIDSAAPLAFTVARVIKKVANE